jgi:hypothetical protein
LRQDAVEIFAAVDRRFRLAHVAQPRGRSAICQGTNSISP